MGDRAQGLPRIQIQSAAVEEDRRSVVFAVAKPTSRLLDHLDIAVEAFGCGVGDVILEVGGKKSCLLGTYH